MTPAWVTNLYLTRTATCSILRWFCLTHRRLHVDAGPLDVAEGLHGCLPALLHGVVQARQPILQLRRKQVSVMLFGVASQPGQQKMQLHSCTKPHLFGHASENVC